jgi:hypothetical protein
MVGEDIGGDKTVGDPGVMLEAWTVVGIVHETYND